MRSKEDAHDYRYFQDPDLLPLELDEAFLDECRASLPELPDAKRHRYEAAGISPYQAGVLTAEVEAARTRLTSAGAMGRLFQCIGISARGWPEPAGFPNLTE